MDVPLSTPFPQERLLASYDPNHNRVEEQVRILQARLPTLTDARFVKEVGKRGLKVPPGMEALFVLPKLDRLAGSHEEALSIITEIFLGARIDPKDCVVSAKTAFLFRKMSDMQRGDFIVFWAQMGKSYLGKSAAEAFGLVENSRTGEFGVDIVSAVMMAATNPNRFTGDPNLNMDAIGSITRHGFMFALKKSKSPLIAGRNVTIGIRDPHARMPHHGPATGCFLNI